MKISPEYINIAYAIFGTTGFIYAIANHFINLKKYNQEVREKSASADLKDDEFWERRYNVLNNEKKDQENFWRGRYDNLLKEFQTKEQLSNEIIKTFRDEINQIKNEYNLQLNAYSEKYEKLLLEYNRAQIEYSENQVKLNQRINELSLLLNDYEKRLKLNEND